MPGLRSVCVAVIAGVCSTVVGAQWLVHRNPATPRLADGGPHLVASVPVPPTDGPT
jgi:hypothetical protein